jgi:hypothetical protein
MSEPSSWHQDSGLEVLLGTLKKMTKKGCDVTVIGLLVSTVILFSSIIEEYHTEF